MSSEPNPKEELKPWTSILDEKPVFTYEKKLAAFERRKKFFAENPGMTLHDATPFLPKERCDESEAYFWRKVKEEQETGKVTFD